MNRPTDRPILIISVPELFLDGLADPSNAADAGISDFCCYKVRIMDLKVLFKLTARHELGSIEKK